MLRHFKGGPLDGKTIDMPAFYKSWRVVLPNTQAFFDRPIDPIETFDYELTKMTDGVTSWLVFLPKGEKGALYP